MTPTFERTEYDSRVERFQKRLAELDLGLAVVTAPENICYLTGHETPGYYTYQCLLVPASGEPVLLTRETETINGRHSTWLTQIVGYPDVADPLVRTAELAAELAGSNSHIGLEERSWFLTPAQHSQLVDALAPRPVRPIDSDLAELRLIKSSAEIARLRTAAEITNAGVLAAAKAAVPGATERDVAAAAFTAMIVSGSEYVGMEPFVASGPRAGTIHASWTDRVINPGDGVLIELAASSGRYHAPLMHTVWTGELGEFEARMAKACQEARDETIKLLRPGRTPAEAHARCREVIDSHGLLDTYRKRSGYSVGIAFAPDWGEGHILSLKETEHRPFEPGMVVHAVPTLREGDRAGFGFSGTAVITEGQPEVITQCPLTNLAAQ
ncbi:M24 family metallopeptidase [Mycolicibacterium mageritense]|uniref:Ectoine hydrolase n=1 Tax=Mycolicibacterium mageritense TaxID=53462 RepID=A0AAI8TPZ1_MYCME|nr:Xaa-Pro peptidase family protein [Mycolicibacterium mageritense]BDY26704.1 Ectoine hydrolase [Mycolicibacterium mageritense]